MATSKKKTAQPNMLTADGLLTADDLPEKVIEVPEWGGHVRLKALDAGQWRDVREAARLPDGDVDSDYHDVRFLMAALVEPKLTDDQFGQVMRKNPTVLKRLTGEALTLTHLIGVEAAASRFREAPGDDVGVPDRDTAGDDNRPPEAGDAGS